MHFLSTLRIPLRTLLACLLWLVLLAGCGARTGLREPELEAGAPDRPPTTCQPVDDRCGPVEVCGNGEDDDCNGRVDEGCPCAPGSVQSCFDGPPGRRNVGACHDGAQTCSMAGTWGPCEGAILPGADVCNDADNLCTGCSRQRECPILCPGAGDARVPDGAPFRDYPLRGRDFYRGAARAWRWSVRGGPCDAITVRPSFALRDATRADATFVPQLSGEYTVTLQVESESGEMLSCSWVVHVAGPGVRVEMCYPESDRYDLDLFVHRPGSDAPWYRDFARNAHWPTNDVCGWHNCEAHLRGVGTGFPAEEVPRADWGYAPSPLSECEHTPYGHEWRALGYCANPRLDLDNNLAEGRGVPENINIDTPRDGDTFRVMVQNFSGWRSRPLVNVYCGGRRVATFGAPPDEVPRFEGLPGRDAIGTMWRVADITAHVDAAGDTTGCAVELLHPPGDPHSYYVTRNDPSF
jgi:hypothetical protein